MKKLLIYLLPFFIAFDSSAQDTLPNFSLRNLGENRIVIGWVQNFENVRQITIQRSFDSLKNFKTILSVADPSSPENGYVDAKANNDRMFYRIYIQLDKGVYFFSESKRPVWDTSSLAAARLQKQNNTRSFQMPNFVDSVNNAPAIGSDNRPKPVKWIPSPHVFTNSNGYIKVSLPDADVKKYSIKVFTLNEELLFELKNIPKQNFQLDKSNFMSSGWFNFELYEEGKLKEKNRFYLPKEF